MKKLILAAVVAFSIGLLSLLTTSNCKTCKTPSVASAKLVFSDSNLLATAD